MTHMRTVIVATTAIMATKIATKFDIAKDFFEVTKGVSLGVAIIQRCAHKSTQADASNKVCTVQPKQRIDGHVVGTQEVRDLSEDRLGREHRGTHLLHHCDGQRVVRIIAV